MGCVESKKHGGSISEDYYTVSTPLTSRCAAVAAKDAARLEQKRRNFISDQRTSFKFDKQNEFGFNGAKKTAYWGHSSSRKEL